jgi:hypothetical protein
MKTQLFLWLASYLKPLWEKELILFLGTLFIFVNTDNTK